MATLINTIMTLRDQSLLNGLYAQLEESLSQDRPVNSLLYEIQHISDRITHRAREYEIPTVGTLKTGYRIGHRPPVNDGYSPTLASSAHHLLSMINDNCLVADEQTINSLNALIVENAVAITVYRAMPENQYCLNQGDWVSLSETYTKDHAEGYLGDTPLVVREFLVEANHLYTSEDSANELGFCSLGLQSTRYLKL